ncbi:unnamed protein product, partial [Symbiodinium necroappetens]
MFGSSEEWSQSWTGRGKTDVMPKPASFGKYNDLNLTLTDVQKADGWHYPLTKEQEWDKYGYVVRDQIRFSLHVQDGLVDVVEDYLETTKKELNLFAWQTLATPAFLDWRARLRKLYEAGDRVGHTHPKLVRGTEIWLVWRDWKQGERRWREPSFYPVASR